MKIRLLGLLLLVCLISAMLPIQAWASETGGTIDTGVDTGLGGDVEGVPVASPGAGAYAGEIDVTLTAAGSSAIYYTTGTSAETTDSPDNTSTLYTGAIAITPPMTLKAIAYYHHPGEAEDTCALNPKDGTPWIATYTYTVRTSGGGGGGGGLEPTTTTPQPGVTILGNSVDSTGMFLQRIVAQSADKVVTVIIEAGIRGLTSGGKPLTQISILPVDETIPPPADSNALALYYDIQPEGATFSGNITITMTYDPAKVVPGTEPYIAWYNKTTGKWVRLTTIDIDPVKGTITAIMTHFTVFSVFYQAPKTTTLPPATTTSPVTTTPPATTTSPVTTTAAPTTPVKTTSATTPVEEPTQPFNWGLIIGIVVAAAVVVILIILVVARKRSSTH